MAHCHAVTIVCQVDVALYVFVLVLIQPATLVVVYGEVSQEVAVTTLSWEET